MIEGRRTKTVYAIFADDAFLDAYHEELKKASGFCGLAPDDKKFKAGKTMVRPLYFASEFEATAFAEKHGHEIYVDGRNKNPSRQTLTQEMPVFSDWYSNDEWRSWYKKRPDGKLDRVNVTMADFTKINDAFEEAYKRNAINHHAILEELSLIRFSLWIDEYAMREFRYSPEEDVLTIVVFRNDDGGKNGIVAEFRCSGLKTDGDMTKENLYADPWIMEDKQWMDDAAEMSAWEFLIVNWFIKTLPSHYSKRRSKFKPKQKPKNKGKNRNGQRKVVWRDEYDVSLEGVTRKSISHEIKCLCWGVRGHVRHYKDGREIFIKPYRKGKERNNPDAYEAKTYVKKSE